MVAASAAATVVQEKKLDGKREFVETIDKNDDLCELLAPFKKNFFFIILIFYAFDYAPFESVCTIFFILFVL